MSPRTISVAAAGLCTFINLYAAQALLPTLAEEFGASLTRTGMTVTAPLVAVALVAPFVGGLSDAFGRRRLIVAASLLLVVPTALAATAPSLELLILCRFLQGLVLPFIFAVTVAYIADECPGAKAVRVTSVYATGTIVGGFLGRLVAGTAAEFFGWRFAFLALAGVTLAAALLILALLPMERRFQPVQGWRGSMAGFADQFRNRQVMATAGMGFALLFAIVATFTYANYLLAAPPYSLGPAQLGLVFVVYLLGAVANLVAVPLVLRFGRRATVALVGTAAIAGLLLTLVPSLPAIILGLGVFAMGMFCEQSLTLGYVALAGERARSTAVGLYVTCYYVGGSLGGIAPGLVWPYLGWAGCVAMACAVQAVAVSVAWLVWPRGMALR